MLQIRSTCKNSYLTNACDGIDVKGDASRMEIKKKRSRATIVEKPRTAINNGKSELEFSLAPDLGISALRNASQRKR